jgi:two-component system, chemotaxis family, chemotaxis protein CheY
VGKTVLVVDDSVTMRQMVAFTLQEAGFAVIEGENGQDALAKLGGQPVHAIITDLNMPVMDGISFIKQVRANGAHRFTPILMLTTESQQEKKQQGKAAGATGWIVKPFNPPQLLQVLAKVLP